MPRPFYEWYNRFDQEDMRYETASRICYFIIQNC